MENLLPNIILDISAVYEFSYYVLRGSFDALNTWQTRCQNTKKMTHVMLYQSNIYRISLFR